MIGNLQLPCHERRLHEKLLLELAGRCCLHKPSALRSSIWAQVVLLAPQMKDKGSQSISTVWQPKSFSGRKQPLTEGRRADRTHGRCPPCPNVLSGNRTMMAT